MQLAGRQKEIAICQALLQSTKPEFVAIYGRRRIGKTYLANEIFKNAPLYFEFTGSRNTSAKQQIKKFILKMEKDLRCQSKKPATDWIDALDLLEKELEKHKKSPGKKVIFFDELPWLASRKSGFLEALDHFWNTYLSRRSDIILVVCGSAASWMITNLINHKGGLHNRVTRQLPMSPFSLNETKEFFELNGLQLSRDQIFDIYMVTGGVAHYLNLYKRGQSAAQFINQTCFHHQGDLREEFDRLYESLFDRHQTHVQIVRLLAKHPEGRTHLEISKATTLSSGGTLTKALTELEKSGFIVFTPQLQQKKKDGVYRLTDEYSLFYLKWIEPLGRAAPDSTYWQKQQGKPTFNNWAGHAFETVCFKHVEKMLEALGVRGLTTNAYSFRNAKTQIDLVIDRSDRTMNLCEMKFYKDGYSMTADEVKKIKERKKQLESNSKTRRHVFVTLVTPHPADRNKHYLDVVDNEINLSDLF